MKNIVKEYERQNGTAEDPIIKEFNKKMPAGYETKRESKSKRISLVLRPSTKDRIDALVAATPDTSRNDLINEILEEYLKTHDK